MTVTEVSPNSATSKSVESVCEQEVSQTMKSRLWPGSSNDANQYEPSSVQATSPCVNNQNSSNTAPRSKGVYKDNASASKAQSTPTILQASPHQETNKAAGAASCELPGATQPCHSAAASNKASDQARIRLSSTARGKTESAGDGHITGTAADQFEGDKHGTRETGDGLVQRKDTDELSGAGGKDEGKLTDI